VRERGWTLAGELKPGDQLASLDGPWLAVESVLDSGLLTTVYNFRVSNSHTYFVGTDAWGFAVWAHNADCMVRFVVDEEGAHGIARRVVDGGPGLDPGFSPKKGASFFITEGDPFTGTSPNQTISVQGWVNRPDSVRTLQDHDLAMMQARHLHDEFVTAGARNLPENFTSTLTDYLLQPNRRPAEFPVAAADLGLSNTKFKNLLNPRTTLRVTEAKMWSELGQIAKQEPSGFVEVVMTENSHVSRGRRGKFLIVADPLQVRVAGGDAVFTNIFWSHASEGLR